MPMPQEIQLATQRFDRLLADLCERTGLTTRNQAYTTLQAVLLAFRRRLTAREALAFADVLPVVPRAIFVAGWDGSAKPAPFGDRPAMAREVQALRRDHNFSPDTAIEDVAATLRRHVDEAAFDRAIERLPEGAHGFWSERPTNSPAPSADRSDREA